MERRRWVAKACSLLIVGLCSGCFDRDPATAGDPGIGGTSAAARCVLPADADRLTDQVLQLINLERAAADAAPVIRSAKLDVMASTYACRMIADGFFGHTDPQTGYGPGDRAVVQKYSFFAIGENLAAGQPTPADVMKTWMESPAHKAIILDPKWTEVGLGVLSGGEYGIYWVQEFAVPADFRVAGD